jgi:hypothetical protein
MRKYRQERSWRPFHPCYSHVYDWERSPQPQDLAGTDPDLPFRLEHERASAKESRLHIGHFPSRLIPNKLRAPQAPLTVPGFRKESDALPDAEFSPGPVQRRASLDALHSKRKTWPTSTRLDPDLSHLDRRSLREPRFRADPRRIPGPLRRREPGGLDHREHRRRQPHRERRRHPNRGPRGMAALGVRLRGFRTAPRVSLHDRRCRQRSLRKGPWG